MIRNSRIGFLTHAGGGPADRARDQRLRWRRQHGDLLRRNRVRRAADDREPEAATVGVASAGSLGKILVDAKGRTLYLFQKDPGTKSECTGGCAAAWPPLQATGTINMAAGHRRPIPAGGGRKTPLPAIACFASHDDPVLRA